jgi:haloalkane dehalogenase
VPPGFFNWKRAAPKILQRPVGEMLQRGGTAGPTFGSIDAEEKAGYSAPFPSDEYKAGARRFPELVPTPPDDPTGRPQPAEGENNKAAWAVFAAWEKPVLLAFSDEDNVMLGCDRVWMEHCPGTAGQPHVTIKGCGHFLQDGGADQLTDAVVAFISHNPPNPNPPGPAARL